MFHHVTVLLEETVDQLNIDPNGIYVDCTLGGAGHSLYLVKQLQEGHLISIDQDQTAIDNAHIVIFLISLHILIFRKLTESYMI